MKNLNKNSISTGRVSLPQCDNRDNRDNRPTPHTSHLTPFLLSLFSLLLFCLLPFGARAQTITLNNGDNYTNNISVSVVQDLVINVPNGTATISGIISGGNSMVGVMKSGAGKLILTNNNSYISPTVVVGGTLQVGNGTSGGSISNTAYVNIYSGAILRFEPAANMTFSKEITGSGKVEYKGSSEKMLILTADNTFTGSTIIETGYLFLGDNTPTGMVAGNISNNDMVCFAPSINRVYSGVISGTGSITKYQAGKTLTLNGDNTYSGATYIIGGTLALGTTGKIENSEKVMVYSSGKFEVSGNQKIIKRLYGGGEVILNTTLNIGTSGQSDGGGDYSGIISGYQLQKTGTETLTLSGANTYAASTILMEGTIVFSAANNFGTGDIYISGSSQKTLQWASGNTADISGRINFSYHSGSAWLDIGSNNVTFASNFKYFNTPTGSLVKAGSGKLTITAANTYPGDIIVNSGTLQVGNGTSGSINPSSVYIWGGATLRFEPSGLYLFDKIISGPGKVEYKGYSTTKLLAFTANNSYTGTTTVESGCLSIGANTSTGHVAGNITVNSGAFIHLSRSNPYTYSGVISGNGSVIKYHAETTTLLGENSYSGETTVDGGTLKLSNGGNIGYTSSVSVSSGATLRFESNSSLYFPKVISGAGNVVKSGTGTLTLSGNNTATGSLTLDDGTLVLSNKWSGNFIKGMGSTLEVVGNVTIGGTLTMRGGLTKMNLSGSTPSKISATGALSSFDNNTLNIIAIGSASSYPLITASSGVSTSNYTTSGSSGTLSATSTTLTFTPTPTFVSVTNITGVPTAATATLQLPLTGTVVPSNATNQAITWSVDNAGTTGATISGNTLNTTNSGTVIVKATIANGTAVGTPYTQTFNITVTKAVLGGEVGISILGFLILDGKAVFGETLTAYTDDLTSIPAILSLGTLSYQWIRGTTNISGATSATYTLVKEDVGQYIKLQVSAANCSGTVMSGNILIGKATQNAPGAPTLASNTSTSITLNTVAGCEYNRNGGAWQSSPIFTGLTPNTQYTFTQRLKETETHFASQPSGAANFTTKDGTEVPQVLSVEITPKSANVQPEQTKQFSATVTVVGGAPETVTWSITGNLSTLTAINSNGLLTIGINETAKTITVKATSTFNTAKFDEATVTVGSVGIQTITNDELRITVYPNPTTGELRIECRDALQCVFTNVEIYDIYGKKCHVSRVTRPRSAEAEPQPNNQPSTQSLNISAFPSGVYFLKINTENGTITKKVIKQ